MPACTRASLRPNVASAMFGFFTKPSRKKFAALVVAELRQRSPDVPYEFNEAEFMLTAGERRIWLQNTYLAYCQAKGDHRRRILERFATMAATFESETPSPWTEAAASLITGVRETVVFDFTTSYITTGDAEKKLQQVRRPFTRWFSQTLLLDAPTHVSYVGAEQLQAWGVGLEEAFALGLANLREVTAPQFTLEDDIHVSAWHDDYDASRLLVPEVFAGLPLNGNPVIAAPNRLTLLVTGDRDAGAVQRLLERAEQIVREQPKPQNPAPLTIRDGQVVDFHVPPDSPLAPAVQRAHGIAALMYYQDQQRILEEFHTKTGKDIHVGKFTLRQHPDGSYRSFAMWAREVATLLPEADEVVFFDPEQPKGDEVIATVPWERVRAVLADQMLDTKLFPPRYYLNSFPTAEQLAALRAGGT